jgi:hypothetical protein
MKTIINIVDKHLQKLIGLGLNMLPHKYAESEMCNPDDTTTEWRTWSPVASKVTDAEIQSLENDIGYSFPGSYKIFLKHKHFYELMIADVSFASHIINTWQKGIREMVFEGYPREFLIDKGLIPFANYSDWGLLCFNTAKKTAENEYEIVLWDHERWDEVEFKYENFTAMMLALDAEEKNN